MSLPPYSAFSSGPAKEYTTESSYEINDIENLENNNNKNLSEIEEKIGPVIDKSKIYLTYSRLGEGSYGKVVKAYYFGNEVAVKILDTRNQNLEEIEKSVEEEAKILAKIKSPNIVTFYGYNFKPPFIVTEFCPNGSLYEIIEFSRLFPKSKAAKKLQSWNKRLSLAIKIADGMCYLHDKQTNIVHGDLKSPNILMDKDGHAKITDFGLSCLIKREGSLELIDNKVCDFNNPLWSAPETLSDDILTKKSDVFSFGIILWELLTFKRPYDLNSKDPAAPYRLALEIMENDVRPDIPCDYSKFPGSWDPILESYVKLIQDCWNKNPDDRPDFPYINKKLSTIRNAMFPEICHEHVIKMNEFGDVFEIIQQMKSFKSTSLEKKCETPYTYICSKLISCAMLIICLLFLLTSMTISFLTVIFTSCDHYKNSRRCRRKNESSNKIDNYENNPEFTETVNTDESKPIDSPNDTDKDKNTSSGISDDAYEPEPELIASIVERESIDDGEKASGEPKETIYIGSLIAPENNNKSIIVHPESIDANENSDSKISDIRIPLIVSTIVLFVVIVSIGLLSYLIHKNKKMKKIQNGQRNIGKKECKRKKEIEVSATKRSVSRKLCQLLDGIDDIECSAKKQEKINKIKEIGSSCNLAVVVYDIPSTEDWKKLRSILMKFLKENNLEEQEKFIPIYSFLEQHQILNSQREWIDFFTMFLSLNEINKFDIWNQIKGFFVHT